MIVPKINLQQFAELEVAAVSDMSKDEIAEEIAKLENEEGEEGEVTEEEFEEEEFEEEGIEGGEGEVTEEEPDAYAFIKKNTPYDSLDALVDGHKNIQSFATKVHQENIELKERLAKISGNRSPKEEDGIEEIGEEGLSGEDIQKMINSGVEKRMAEEGKKRAEEKVIEDEEIETKKFNDKLDAHFDEASALEGWNENQDKVFGIIKQYPGIADKYSGNPYVFALKLATNPELMKIYNKRPNLFNLKDGGLGIANEILDVGKKPEVKAEETAEEKVEVKGEKKPGEKKVETKPAEQVSEEANEEGIEEQVELLNSSVATPSQNTEENLSIENMSREQVFEAVGHKPD